MPTFRGIFGISIFVIMFATFINCCCYTTDPIDDYTTDDADLRIITKPLGRMDSFAVKKLRPLSDSNNNLSSITGPAAHHFDSLNSQSSIRTTTDSLARGISSQQNDEISNSTNSKEYFNCFFHRLNMKTKLNFISLFLLECKLRSANS